jgi:hypothetical protein
MPAAMLAKHPPAWAAYAGGPWPTPHDPIYDSTESILGNQWLDDLAAEAARVLGPLTAPEVIGHSRLGVPERPLRRPERHQKQGRPVAGLAVWPATEGLRA